MTNTRKGDYGSREGFRDGLHLNPYANAYTISSYTAGLSIGRKLYNLNSNYTPDKMHCILSRVRVPYTIHKLSYILGIVDAYTHYVNESGNFDPLFDLLRGNIVTTYTQERRETLMGKLYSTKQAIVKDTFGESHPWVSVATLEEFAVPFCITDIKWVTIEGAKKWYISIKVSPTNATITGADENGMNKISFDFAKGPQPSSRDQLFNRLRKTTPVHCIMVVRRETKQPQGFLDLIEVNGTCPCGEVVTDAVEEYVTPPKQKVQQGNASVVDDALGELDDHPF